jgi:hypothetical protein
VAFFDTSADLAGVVGALAFSAGLLDAAIEAAAAGSPLASTALHSPGN